MKGSAVYARRKISLISLVALFSPGHRHPHFWNAIKGMINGRSGEKFTVKSDHGDVTVLLTDGTTTRDETGLFGLGNEKMGPIVLIPGPQGGGRGRVQRTGPVCRDEDYHVDGDDLETSGEMIEAGITPTAKQGRG